MQRLYAKPTVRRRPCPGARRQVAITRGMKYVQAASASVILYLQVLFATVWGLMLLGERPHLWTLAGSVLVLSGTVVAARHGPE